METKTSAKIRFNKPLFCLYQATSDDLMFWPWFDVLFLSICYGLDSTQTSLVFSVSFWIALMLKIPGDFLAKKMGAGRSVMLAAVLFLAAAVLLTFGSTIAVAIIGQSIYLIAGSFQQMSTVILKNVAGKDPAHIDYAKIMSVSGTVFSVVSLIAAALMNPLCDINKSLPMYVCIGFCLNSCVLAFFVSRYDSKSIHKEQEAKREALPGAKSRSFDRTTISCLVLSVLFIVIFTVSGNVFKIMLEDDLSSLTSESGTIFIFSMILLISRVVKMMGNGLLFISRKKRMNQERFISFVVFGVIVLSGLGVASRWGTGYTAVVLVFVAFLMRVLIYDPFRVSVYDFMLKRLKDNKMIDVLFVNSIGSDIFTALFSTVTTILLGFGGMAGVSGMLLVLSILFSVGFFVLRKNLIRTHGNRGYLKWDRQGLLKSDVQWVATTVLLMHYGITKDASYTPERLEERIQSLEEIHSVFPSIRYDGIYEYDEKLLKELFDSGHPCAVKAVIHEGEPYCWLAVMYMDEDGGVVWNPYTEEKFLVQFYQIQEICSYTITDMEKRKNGLQG